MQFGPPIRTKAAERRVSSGQRSWVYNGTGAQNQSPLSYSTKRRLAVELNGHVTVYDTLDHQISVSQQRGAAANTYQPAWDSCCLNSAGRLGGRRANLTPEPRVAPATNPIGPTVPDGPLRQNRAAGQCTKGILVGRIRS
jgi:hypothetical protein